jgi:hypothetical protein
MSGFCSDSTCETGENFHWIGGSPVPFHGSSLLELP